MNKNIFCNTCGNTLKLESTICSCGNVMTIEVKNEMASKMAKIFNSKLVISDSSKKIDNYFAKLPNYSLEKRYIIASSAIKDYEKKVNFIKEAIIPEITEWKDKVEKGDSILANDKIEIYGKIIGISDFVINDFFGRFKNKTKELELFAEYRDFSRYELSKVMLDHNIVLDDIKTVNFETIGIDVFNAVGDTLHNGSFLALSEKDEITDADIKGVKAELGVAVLSQLINGIGNLIGQNSEAIGNVREADNNLNQKLEQISTVIHSLNIEEQEINKQKQLFDKSDLIVDSCYNNVLRPIVEALNDEPVFKRYKINRIPYELQHDKVEIENQALKVEIEVTFWGCLLKTAKRNFNSNLNKRLLKINKINKYLEINTVLNEKPHKSLKGKFIYDEESLDGFIAFEEKNRLVLRKEPIIKEYSNIVIGFLGVLHKIKNNIKK